MIGELEKNNRFPLCGGRLKHGLATMPFFLPKANVLIKDVPAEICASCHEPYITGRVTDRIVGMLQPLRAIEAEVLLLSYKELHRTEALTAAVEA